MSDTQITLEFLANTDGLKAATQQMQLLGKVSKEQYALFVKANRDAQQAIAAMAKEQATTGKVFNDTAKQAGELNLQYRQMGQFIATGAVNELTKHFVGLASQIVANNEKLTELNAQLSQLQQTINSGQLEGEALVKAKDNAADLVGQVKDATEAAEKLGAAFKSEHLQFYGNSLNMVVSGLAAAQSGAALFGVENEKLKETLLKAQAATALVTSAQQGFGAALKVVSYLEQQFAATSATAWAAATGGISVLVTAVAGLVAYLSSANDEVADLQTTSGQITKNGAEEDLRKQEQILAKALGDERKLLADQEKWRKYNSAQGNDTRRIELEQIEQNIVQYNQKIKSYQYDRLSNSVVSGGNETTREQYANIIGDYLNAAMLRKNEINKQLEQEAKESSRKQIELTIRTLELQRAATIKGSEEDIALFKQVQAQKLELAKLNGAGAKEQAIITKEQENTLQQYIGKQLKAKQDAHQQGMEQLRQNAAEEAAFIAEFEAHKLEIQQAYENMSIEEFKQWVEEKRAIYTQQALDEQRNQQALAQLKTNHAIDEGLLRDHYITLEEIDEDYVQFQNETGKDSYEQFEEWERKKLEARKRTNAEMSEDDKKIVETAISITQQAADTMFTIEAAHRQARLDAELQDLGTRRDKELSSKNLTEAQKDAINKRYATEEANLKRRAYEQDKQSKMAQAAINGALAITNILATLPKTTFGVLDAVMIASAVASTAAQIAVIAATPIPKFATGGKNIPAGMKLVGEQGPELIWTPGGETVIPHGDTAKILEAWSIPVPNVNPALKTDMAIAAALPAGINYNKLATVLAQELRNNPSVNINMDSNGFAMHLLQKNKNVQLLNNRYSA